MHHIPQPQEHTGRPEFDYEYKGIYEDEIDLIELFQYLWSKRVKIAKITIAFLLLGLIIAIFSPVEYKTSATILPEAQGQGQLGGLLQQYGGLLGVGGNSNTGKDGAISPQLYPNIVQSLPYQVELMNKPIYFSEYDTTITAHQFFSEVSSPSLFGYLKRYTIGLPGQVLGLFRNKSDKQQNSLVTNVNRDSVLLLPMKQMETIYILRDRVNVVSDNQTGLLTFSVEMPDARAAAELGQAGLEQLKEYVREYRTQKATEDLKFVREQVSEAKKRFEEAQQALAEFRDANVNLATAKARTREQELQSKYDLTFNMYNSLNKQLEQEKLNVQEDTPVFSVLQPIQVPLEKESPQRLLILIIFGILGVFIGLTWAVISMLWVQAEKNRVHP